MRNVVQNLGFPGRLLSAWPFFLVACFAVLQSASAQAVDPMAGKWKGAFTIPGQQEQPLVLKLDQTTDGSWMGQVQSQADSTVYEDLPRISVSGSAVSFRYRPPTIPGLAIFSGNYQSWSDQIKGIIIVGNYNIPLLLGRVGLHPDEAAALADTSLAALEAEEKFIRVRHENNWALAGRAAYWVPVHVLKEDQRNINDITTGNWAFSGGVRWYIIDDLALNVRATRGGLNFKSNEKNLSLYEAIGLNSDSFLRIDGIESVLTIYVGDVSFRTSKFNPFVSLLVGYYEWELTESGRGSQAIEVLERPLKDKDMGVGFGLGTEYPLSRVFALEFEWMWQFVFTQDTEQWSDEIWTSTNFWSLNLGLVINF